MIGFVDSALEFVDSEHGRAVHARPSGAALGLKSRIMLPAEAAALVARALL